MAHKFAFVTMVATKSAVLRDVGIYQIFRETLNVILSVQQAVIIFYKTIFILCGNAAQRGP